MAKAKIQPYDRAQLKGMNKKRVVTKNAKRKSIWKGNETRGM